MKIKRVYENKKKYLDLLLLADEQESMIDRYLERGEMYALDDDGIKAVCVVTDEGDGVFELKNIAVYPEFHRRGYGKAMIDFIFSEYAERAERITVGTGDSPLTVLFYENSGFVRSHVVKNFFTDNYDHPMYECGKQLIDMIYFEKKLKQPNQQTELRDL